MTDLTETTPAPVGDFREGLRLLTRSSGTKLLAGALAMALIFTMATLSVVEGNRKAKSKTTLEAIGANGQPITDANGNPVTDANGNPVTGSSGSGSGSSSASGGATGAAGGTGGKAVGATSGGGSTSCTDANPSQGVTCDLVLIGGITVLSGPLGIYGEQGLQGGQAWLSYFNSVYAPQHHLRKSKLIYYDDHGADPSQDATLTQRLVEQDHVFAIAGMPAPQGADPYLRQHRIPLIGDLGLNPISFQSPMIWPTAPNTATNAKVTAQVITDKFHPTKIGVILSPLPGEDYVPIEDAERAAYKAKGADVVKFEVMTTDQSDCNSHLLQIQNASPDFLELPVVSTPFLLCIQAAQSQGFYPGGSNPKSAALKGWQGGSGIGVEMDQCGSLCNGMYSHGTLFYDPNVYSNHDPSWGMDLYNANMAKYASNVDKTSIISENYYVAGMINSKLNELASSSAPGLTREHLIALANKFRLDTGMGYIVDWGAAPNNTNAHSGTQCGFPQVAGPGPGGGKTIWNTIPNKVCAT